MEFPSVVCDAVLLDDLGEIALSDVLSSKFGIVVLDAAKGLWRFSDETTPRKSKRKIFPKGSPIEISQWDLHLLRSFI